MRRTQSLPKAKSLINQSDPRCGCVAHQLALHLGAIYWTHINPCLIFFFLPDAAVIHTENWLTSDESEEPVPQSWFYSSGWCLRLKFTVNGGFYPELNCMSVKQMSFYFYCICMLDNLPNISDFTLFFLKIYQSRWERSHVRFTQHTLIFKPSLGALCSQTLIKRLLDIVSR